MISTSRTFGTNSTTLALKMSTQTSKVGPLRIIIHALGPALSQTTHIFTLDLDAILVLFGFFEGVLHDGRDFVDQVGLQTQPLFELKVLDQVFGPDVNGHFLGKLKKLDNTKMSARLETEKLYLISSWNRFDQFWRETEKRREGVSTRTYALNPRCVTRVNFFSDLIDFLFARKMSKATK